MVACSPGPRGIPIRNVSDLCDPLDCIQTGPVAGTRLDGVPLAHTVLEPASPLGGVRTVLGMSGAVLSLDHPEAVTGVEGEAVGVVIHGSGA